MHAACTLLPLSRLGRAKAFLKRRQGKVQRRRCGRRAWGGRSNDRAALECDHVDRIFDAAQAGGRKNAHAGRAAKGCLQLPKVHRVSKRSSAAAKDACSSVCLNYTLGHNEQLCLVYLKSMCYGDSLALREIAVITTATIMARRGWWRQRSI